MLGLDIPPTSLIIAIPSAVAIAILGVLGVWLKKRR